MSAAPAVSVATVDGLGDVVIHVELRNAATTSLWRRVFRALQAPCAFLAGRRRWALDLLESAHCERFGAHDVAAGAGQAAD